jgi:branched-chain amino acid transport system substrate-binding protein
LNANRLYQVAFSRSGPAWVAQISVLLILGLLIILPCSTHGDQQAIRVAAIYSYSGPFAESNLSSVRGVRMAVEEINKNGGLLGRRLELLEIDNLGTPIGSRKAALKAVQYNVAAIIGAAFSTHSIAVARVAQDHGIPMITNVSTTPRVTRIGDYIFRVCFNDRLQGEVMARFAREELRARTAVTVFDVNSDYSMGLSHTFERAFAAGGGTLLARLPYRTMQPHFRDLVVRVRSMQPDVLFIAGHGESARILLEADREDVTSIPLGGDGWDDEGFSTQGGDKIKLGYFTTHWSPSMGSELSKRFVARYGEDGQIRAPTALGYDAVNLLADAIIRAGTVRRSDIRNALAATRDFKGVTGAITFDGFGDPVKNVVVMKIQDGQRLYLKQEGPGQEAKTAPLHSFN